jgi:DNA modification methylase
LKNNIILDSEPSRYPYLEILIKTEKTPAITDEIKNILVEKLKGEPVDEQNFKTLFGEKEPELIVVSGNHRVSIFSELLKITDEDDDTFKNLKFRPCHFYFSLSIPQIESLGASSNNDIRVPTTELDLFKWLNMKSKTYNHEWKTPIKLDPVNTVTLFNYVYELRLKSFYNLKLTNQGYQYIRLAQMSDDIIDEICKFIENRLPKKHILNSLDFLCNQYTEREILKSLTDINNGTEISKVKKDLQSDQAKKEILKYLQKQIDNVETFKKCTKEINKLITEFHEMFIKRYKFPTEIFPTELLEGGYLILRQGKICNATQVEISKLQLLSSKIKKLKNPQEERNIDTDKIFSKKLITIYNEDYKQFLKMNENDMDDLDLVFMDIPYDNYTEIPEPYNKETLDLDDLVKNLCKIHEKNKNKSLNIVIFGNDDQLYTLKKTLEEKDFKVTEQIWGKTKSLNNFTVKNIKGYINHEKFLVVNKGPIYHKLFHNSIKATFEIEALINKLCKDGNEEKVKKIVTDHFESFETGNRGNSVWLINDTNRKFQIEKQILNKFEKPQTLLQRILRSFSKENSNIVEFCAGSGSLAQACLKLGRKYIGYEKNQGQFLGSVERIKMIFNKTDTIEKNNTQINDDDKIVEEISNDDKIVEEEEELEEIDEEEELEELEEVSNVKEINTQELLEEKSAEDLLSNEERSIEDDEISDDGSFVEFDSENSSQEDEEYIPKKKNSKKEIGSSEKKSKKRQNVGNEDDEIPKKKKKLSTPVTKSVSDQKKLVQKTPKTPAPNIPKTKKDSKPKKFIQQKIQVVVKSPISNEKLINPDPKTNLFNFPKFKKKNDEGTDKKKDSGGSNKKKE